MSSYLCITVRFLQPFAHGRMEGGEPEWPPSPLRLFQALVAAAAARWNERQNVETAVPALRWLEAQAHPMIVAPEGAPSKQSYRLYVPDNVGDKVAKSWQRGGEGDIADYRTEKDVRPTHLAGEAVHYLYSLSEGHCPHVEVLSAAARSITHLGWGIDMAVGDAQVVDATVADRFTGDRWVPAPSEGTSLRVPMAGTLADLVRKHTAFLNRLGPDGFRPVPPLSAYRVVGYRRGMDPASRPFAAYSILKRDASSFRAFDTVRNATVVAAMVRHALSSVAELQRPFGWSDQQIARVVLGHDESGKVIREEPTEPRFAYLPLPTIERRGGNNGSHHVGLIRRVVVVGTPGMNRELDWARRMLSGTELIHEGHRNCMALLSTIPVTDWVVSQYTRPASVWTTVTPVIVPGFDNRRPAKTERLLRKALRQAGFAEDLVQHADLEWRGVGFLPGVDLACRYRRPRNVGEAPVCHVRIQWRNKRNNALPIAGPIAVGSGRFRGLGLFVSCA